MVMVCGDSSFRRARMVVEALLGVGVAITIGVGVAIAIGVGVAIGVGAC